METIQVLEHNAARVLTTKQLASFYETNEQKVIQNFNNNKERFVEGKHYHCLEGKELRDFKHDIDNIDIVRINKLYLWTEKGAARHAKILSTDKAWEVFEELEDTYFRAQVAKTALPQTPTEALLASVQALVNIERQVTNHEERLALVEKNGIHIRFTQPYEFTQHQLRLRQRSHLDAFVEERIRRTIDASITFASVYSAYKSYCQQGEYESLTKRAFSHLMRAMGIESTRKADGIYFINILLNTEAAQ
jgi:hypothetical protein